MTSETPDYKKETMEMLQELLKGLRLGSIETSIINDKQKKKLVKYMHQLAEELRDPTYEVDAQRVERASAIILVGLKDGGEIAGMNCGACGFPSCEDMLKNRRAGLLFPGPTCIIRALDLGMAVGFLAKTFSTSNEDSNIMLRIGVAAKRLDFLKSDLVMGVLLKL